MFREYGGEFSALDTARATELEAGPVLAQLIPGATLWGSGRGALRALLAGKRWKRIWLPSYICPEVVSAAEGVAVAFYKDHPLLAPAGLPEAVQPGDLVLRVNYFGLRGAEEAERSVGDVVEDHTHDPTGPWARASRAPFALASLRKTYPTTDGGVLWSPTGAALPAEREPTAHHLAAADAKLHAMALKGQFLRGRSASKEEYRLLSTAGEERIGTLSGPDPETRKLLRRCSPVVLARHRRAAWEKLAPETPFTLTPRGDPFALVLDLETEKRRDSFLRALVVENIFPSILWPLSWWKTDKESRAVSKRLLTVATDFRYPDDAVANVARVLRFLA